MGDQIRELLADPAAALVKESFTGVSARWWWERRISGGIELCQELDPERMSREIAESTGRSPTEVMQVLREELGLEDTDPVVLTFEVPGDATAREAARALAEHSADPEGLAAPLYRRVEEIVKAG
ncbi:MAG TPA: hypothetical protein VFJ72_03235 [Rubrobacteraceae bacterium]|nr:hypothetical protein [Rubrobacteraceae bacterium]